MYVCECEADVDGWIYELVSIVAYSDSATDAIMAMMTAWATSTLVTTARYAGTKSAVAMAGCIAWITTEAIAAAPLQAGTRSATAAMAAVSKAST